MGGAILYQLAIKKNVPTDMSPGQCDLGNPALEDPYFQLTLICIILIAKLARAFTPCQFSVQIHCLLRCNLPFLFAPKILHQHHNVKYTTTLSTPPPPQSLIKFSEF